MTAQFTGEAGTRGEFVRQGNRFADRITADSATAPTSSGAGRSSPAGTAWSGAEPVPGRTGR